MVSRFRSPNIDIDGPAVRAKKGLHESGFAMIEFLTFRPSPLTVEKINDLLETAKSKLGLNSAILCVDLNPEQATERQLLENLGFELDRIKYGVEFEKLKQTSNHDKFCLPQNLQIR